MKTIRLALLLMSFVLVAACGTKGDLVLPGTPAKASAPAPAPAAAPDPAESPDEPAPADGT